MRHEYTSLIVLGSLWLLGVLAGFASLLGRSRRPLRWFWFRCALAASAILIGGIGFWTPFSSWPDLTYTWTSGSFSITIIFSWLFLAPMLLGALALVLVIRSNKKWKSDSGDGWS